MKIKLCVAAMALLSQSAFADVAVIVHPSNTDALDNGSISRIFIGKAKSFPGGGQAVPINQAEGGAVTNEFNDTVLKKSASQLKAYWSKLVFTGKGTPPTEVANDSEVIKLISANPSLIGYVDSAAVDSSVKVIATF